MSDRDRIAADLSAKLDASHVKPAEKYGPKGDYLEGWFCIAEANRIFGWDGWTRENVETRCVSERERKVGREQKDGWGVTYTAKVRVTAHGVVREGTGAGSGIDVDCGLAHESAIKEAETDAMKRALMTFGNPFGLALYDKKRENVEMPARANQKPAPTQAPAGQPSLSQQAAPAGPREEPTLTKAAGEAILLGISNCKDKAALDAYMTALKSGPMGFAATHPKIKVAASERYAELDPIPFGEMNLARPV